MSVCTGNGSVEVKWHSQGHVAIMGKAGMRNGSSGPFVCASLLFWSCSVILCSHSCLCHFAISKLNFLLVVPQPGFSHPLQPPSSFGFFFFRPLGHRCTRSPRLFLKGQWKATEQCKSHISCPTLAVWRGLNCYGKTAGLEVSEAEQIWDWTFLALALAIYGDSLSSFGLNYCLHFEVGAQLLNLNAKGFLQVLQCLLLNWFS